MLQRRQRHGGDSGIGGPDVVTGRHLDAVVAGGYRGDWTADDDPIANTISEASRYLMSSAGDHVLLAGADCRQQAACGGNPRGGVGSRHFGDRAGREAADHSFGDVKASLRSSMVGQPIGEADAVKVGDRL